jgi:hypothetical protein
MLSPWRKFRAHLAVEIAQLLGVPVTVDVEFQFPELRSLGCEVCSYPKLRLLRKSFRCPVVAKLQDNKFDRKSGLKFIGWLVIEENVHAP